MLLFCNIHFFFHFCILFFFEIFCWFVVLRKIKIKHIFFFFTLGIYFFVRLVERWVVQVAAAVLLLAKGADRHLRDHEGRTAMDWASRFGSTRLLDVLLFNPNKVRPLLLKDGCYC